MYTPDHDLLVEFGQRFRDTAVTDEFVAGVGPHVRAIPDAVLGQYSLTRMFYTASPIETPVITTDGLFPGMPVIDEADKTFFSEQFREQQFRRMEPNDGLVVNSFIFNQKADGTPKDVVVTTKPDKADLVYSASPEHLTFFMRNLGKLASLTEVDQSVREHADVLVQKYAGRLVTNGQIQLAMYKISTRSPSLGRCLLHPMLAESGASQGVEMLRIFQNGPSRVTLPGGVQRSHLLLDSSPRVDAEAAMLHIMHNDGMVVFKPSRRY